jgi:hypothetical protein
LGPCDFCRAHDGGFGLGLGDGDEFAGPEEFAVAADAEIGADVGGDGAGGGDAAHPADGGGELDGLDAGWFVGAGSGLREAANCSGVWVMAMRLAG